MESTPTKSAANSSQIMGNENATKANPDAPALLHETEVEEETHNEPSEMEENSITAEKEEEDDDDLNDSDTM